MIRSSGNGACLQASVFLHRIPNEDLSHDILEPLREAIAGGVWLVTANTVNVNILLRVSDDLNWASPRDEFNGLS